MPNQDEELKGILRENLRLFEISKEDTSDKITWFNVYGKFYKVEFSQAISSIKQWARRMVGEDEDTEYSGLTYGDTNLDLTAVNYGKNEAKQEIRQRIERG